MTSRHLFFRAMWEDARHKLWMAALSVLGSFLALPVGWMIWRSNKMDYWGGIDGLLQRDAKLIAGVQDEIIGFFGVYLLIAGGIIAFVMALITGLSCFRYLFHKNMVDTWHSLPVKRDTLYRVHYMNGILIWFVPFGVSLLLMLCLCVSLLGQVGGTARIGELLGNTAISLLVLAVLYLLLYHVALAAVMLSGNVLNTLVCLIVLGAGAMALYGIGILYFDTYMGTYYMPALKLKTVIYGSPFFSGFMLLQARIEETNLWAVWKALLINAGVAAGLGVASWLLYRNRASEAAEQGICSKLTAAVFRVLFGAAAGMCGWGFFLMLVNDSRALGWGIFGAVLAGVCAFGVLDIIFQMDFKAFFSHKAQMAGAVAASLLLCFAFYWDWFGYDTRLPEKEEIAEIALFDRSLANRYYYYGVRDRNFESMHYQDKDAIYAFLERMTEHEREEEITRQVERVTVKVTLENGKSYYRHYWVRIEDKELLWRIVTDREYLKHAYLIEDDILEECISYRVGMVEDAVAKEYASYKVGMGENDYGMWGKEYDYKDAAASELRTIVEAYNEDILENPDRVLLGEGRIAAEVTLRIAYMGEDGMPEEAEIALKVYENMERTMEALKATGYEAPDADALGVKAIELEILCDKNAAPQERIAMAREAYGVPEQGEGGSGQEDTGKDSDTKMDGAGKDGNTMSEADGAGEAGQESTGKDSDTEAGHGEIAIAETRDEGCASVTVTDPEEVSELFGLLGFEGNYWQDTIFGNEKVLVRLVMEDGSRQTWRLPKGTLPEKYILRFGE